VNLYLPSEVKWDRSGQVVTIVQSTDFPETGKVSLKISGAEPAEFSVKFRVPGWVGSAVSVKVNHTALPGTWRPGYWGEIKRTWADGDEITIDFPMPLYFLPVDRYHPNLAALMIGPVVLVSNKGGVLHGDMEQPASWIAAVPDQSLTFAIKEKNDYREFRPYYAYGQGEKYFMYHEIERSRNDKEAFE
jgi:DUF1680 family protein